MSIKQLFVAGLTIGVAALATARDYEATVTGVTAIIFHDDEAVLVNIAGSINPEQLAQAANTFGAGEPVASLGQFDGAN